MVCESRGCRRYVTLFFFFTARRSRDALCSTSSLAIMSRRIAVLLIRNCFVLYCQHLWRSRCRAILPRFLVYYVLLTLTLHHTEKALIALRKQQREKIEEIKNKTNYYSTRNLIERYDDGPRPSAPATPQRPTAPRQPPQPQMPPQTPARIGGQLNPQTPAPAHMSPSLQQQLSRAYTTSVAGSSGPLTMMLNIASPLRPMPPPRKQWFDKLADAILGDDDGGTVGAAASRYALICQKCFAHNGLVKESVWEDARTFSLPSVVDLRASHGPRDRIRLPEVWAFQSVCAIGARGAFEVGLTRRTRTLAGIPAKHRVLTNATTAANSRSARWAKRRSQLGRTACT